MESWTNNFLHFEVGPSLGIFLLYPYLLEYKFTSLICK